MNQWHKLLNVEWIRLREPYLSLNLLLRLLLYNYLFVRGQYAAVEGRRWTHGIIVFVLIVIGVVFKCVYGILVVEVSQIGQLTVLPAGETASSVLHLVCTPEIVS